MMMKKLLVILCAAVAVTSFAAGASTNKVKRIKRPRIHYPGGEAEARLHNYGEKIEKAGTGKGRIVFVDTTAEYGGETLAKLVRYISGDQRLHMEVVKGEKVTAATAGEAAKKLGANAVVFVVSDSTLPMSLVAYEESWGIANVAKAMDGAPTKIVAKDRAKKLVFRTFANTCGAGEGLFQVAVMGPVKSAADLDMLKMEDPIPPTILGAIGAYMVKAGMEATTTAYYRDACEEGWAPAPKNDIEKAIWDRVHAMPKNPMKIKFDPAKGR